MSSTRRYTEKEIAQIFEEATRAQNESEESGGAIHGLSLEELKQIGASTGIDPRHIIRAASALHKQPQLFPVRKHLGIPIGVSRSIELPDTFSDQDWEHLVVDLRKTFRAKGTIKQEGSLREWSNGNLQALVEPTPSGYELRLETKKGNMIGFLYGGLGYIFLAFLMLFVLTLDPDNSKTFAFLMSGLFGVLGVSALAAIGFTQPRWARNRERQMEAICKRAASLGKTDDAEYVDQAESTDEKFLSLEDEEVLNQELRQFAIRKKASRA